MNRRKGFGTESFLGLRADDPQPFYLVLLSHQAMDAATQTGAGTIRSGMPATPHERDHHPAPYATASAFSLVNGR